MIEVTFSFSTGELKGVRDLGSSPKDDEAFDDFATLLAKKRGRLSKITRWRL